MDKRASQPSIDVRIGARIRELREASGLAADEVATSAKMSAEDYRMSELGERRFSAIEMYDIARTLGVSFSEIVSVLK